MIGYCNQFTEAEDAMILREGWDDRTLADILFVAAHMIRNRRAYLRAGAPPAPTPRMRPRFSPRAWNTTDVRKAAFLRSQGLRWNEVGAKLGRSGNAARNAVYAERKAACS